MPADVEKACSRPSPARTTSTGTPGDRQPVAGLAELAAQPEEQAGAKQQLALALGLFGAGVVEVGLR
jgi:hypothetical protein